ncbi:hypothetical protein KKF34_09185 [Myxococcota bacterium]|nr:hypothetical protein [Myxococcota bacterium]MBU1379360.1 hypothetical protein [Myxococcota bacterium]MBU1497036.1 hypothetical protein [Myxococcota bacterium]
MNFIPSGIITIVAFILGFGLAALWLKKKQNAKAQSTSGNRNIENLEPENTEEQTRKVELVDIKDLLAMDGDVIEAEPAPTVSEDKLLKAELEIERLNYEIKKLQGREQSKEIALAQLRKKLEDSGPIPAEEKSAADSSKT